MIPSRSAAGSGRGGVGVAVGAGVAVGTGVGVAVGSGVGVAVGVAVGTGLGADVGVAVKAGASAGVGLGWGWVHAMVAVTSRATNAITVKPFKYLNARPSHFDRVNISEAVLLLLMEEIIFARLLRGLTIDQAALLQSIAPK